MARTIYEAGGVQVDACHGGPRRGPFIQINVNEIETSGDGWLQLKRADAIGVAAAILAEYGTAEIEDGDHVGCVLCAVDVSAAHSPMSWGTLTGKLAARSER